MLSIFSCAYWPLVGLLRRNVCWRPLPIFELDRLFFCCWIFRVLRVAWIYDLQIFSFSLCQFSFNLKIPLWSWCHYFHWQETETQGSYWLFPKSHRKSELIMGPQHLNPDSGQELRFKMPQGCPRENPREGIRGILIARSLTRPPSLRLAVWPLLAVLPWATSRCLPRCCTFRKGILEGSLLVLWAGWTRRGCHHAHQFSPVPGTWRPFLISWVFIISKFF